MTRRPITAKIDQPAPDPGEHPEWKRRLVDDNPRGTVKSLVVV